MHEEIDVDDDIATKKDSFVDELLQISSLLNAKYKQKHLLHVTDTATSTDLSEEPKQAISVMAEAINSVCFMYYADLRHLKKLYEADTGQELTESVNFLLYDSFYNLSSHGKVNTLSHEVFGTFNIKAFCPPAKTLIKPGSHG